MMTAHFQRLARREALEAKLEGITEQQAALRKVIDDPARYRSQGVARYGDGGGSGRPGDPTYAVAVSHQEVIQRQEARLDRLVIAHVEAEADLAEVRAGLRAMEIALRALPDDDMALLRWRFGERRSMMWIALRLDIGESTVRDRLAGIEEGWLPVIRAVLDGAIVETGAEKPRKNRGKTADCAGQGVLECV